MFSFLLMLFIFSNDGDIEIYELSTYQSRVECLSAKSLLDHQTSMLIENKFESDCERTNNNKVKI